MNLSEYLDYLRAYRNRAKYTFVKRPDWYRWTVCQEHPRIDPRSIINCCPSSIRCPLRDAVLFSLSGLEITEENYERLMRRYDEYKRSRGNFNVRGFFKYMA